MNIPASEVKRELEKRGYGQRSVMLGLAKSVGLALPLTLKHSDTLTLKEINLVCIQCQVNWNKNQHHWPLKKKKSHQLMFTPQTCMVLLNSSPPAHSPIVLPSVS